MSLLRAFAVFGAASFAALGPAPSRADTLGPIGRVIAFEIVEPSSDEFSSRHGRIVVADAVGGGTISYQWGGNLCAAFDVVDPAFLQRGFDNPRMLIAPAFKPGAGSTPCLVAFTWVLRTDVGTVFP